jgi:hypothetical protein
MLKKPSKRFRSPKAKIAKIRPKSSQWVFVEMLQLSMDHPCFVKDGTPLVVVSADKHLLKKISKKYRNRIKLVSPS